MEDLSKLTDSPLLPIIVLVVIVGVRILARLRRQVRNRDQREKQEDEPQSFQEVHRDPVNPVTVEEAEVLVDDDDEEPPAPVVPPKPVELPGVFPTDTVNASMFTALSSTSSVPVSGEIPAWLQEPVVSPAESAAQPLESRSADAPVRYGNSQAAGSVESRIRLLPPLQQGIVWAEILGTPKGL
jgi:hypothetical protein